MKNLFVTDLDGTFVANSVNVSVDDLAAYKKLKKLGDFSIATGRSISEIEYIIDENDLEVTHMIGFNGAAVESSSIVYKEFIPNKYLNKLFEYLDKNNLVFDALDGEKRIGNFQHEEVNRLWNMELICVNNPFELLKGKNIYKVNIRPSKEETDRYCQELKVIFPNLEVFKSGSRRIEVTAKNVSKALGIEKIRGNYDRVVVLGDSGNDVDMFKVADISYCIDTAPVEVQKKALHVVGSFADAIAHFENNYK